ncbi:MAG TPA: hypothetical protein VFR90_03595 [Methylibium sp.]|uniref:hypothetical protein n=1 Tax=Methylibium sp. TaxID=2067992 RepID=UPI002DBBDAC0|nr:hypothetical protein [Methylibium sp.]HEU4458183.1 hypothetical protein [Methylibium sp.]
MATATDGTWLPGIGDATPAGWFTVVAYAAAAWCCWRLVSRKGLQRAPMPLAQQRFWWLLTAVMAFLSVNKQLDLQTAFTEIGRAVAYAGGWYEQRHQVQVVFIAGVAVLGALLLAALCQVSRPLTRDRALALGGLVFLGSFVVIRAASFHHVDLLINDTVLGLRWNAVFELTGIGLVAAGALQAWRHAPASERPASPAAPRAAPVRAAFTPYRGPATQARSAAPKPRQAATPRSASGDDRPVRSPGDPRNR